jgi:dolichyl-diphosphooligosaccharide--protein glycosyltransferase
LFIGLDVSGLVRNLETKYQAILNPFQRLLYPIVESVQENRPAAWGSIYFDIGIGAFFIPVGFFFAAQNPTNRNIYLILFGLTSIYFASSIVRLTLIMAPAFCLLWALALVKILRPFVTVLKETPTAIRRKTHFQTHVGREFSAAFLILIFLLLTVSVALPSRESSYPRFLDSADMPTTIAVASTPYKPNTPITDWFDALAWIRNTPSVQVVASWWDYGYWITISGNKPSLADNGTFNSTQIAQLGRLFMSNETEAYAMIQDWNKQAQTIGRTNRITHVLVFTTFDSSGTDLNAGDESKWVWMARIGGLNDSLYGNVTGQGNVNWTDLGKTTIIYKMITYAKFQRVSLTNVEIPAFTYFKPAYFSNENLPASERAVQGINAVVAIYEVVYDDTST